MAIRDVSRVTGELCVPVLYLDLDGTVRQGRDDALGKFVNGPEDVVVFPEAVAQMKTWKAKGGRVVGVSNQGGVALGLVREQDVRLAMMETQKQCDFMFDKIMWCIHHPLARSQEMSRCWCRKPSPGLIVEAAISMASQYRGEIYPPHLGLFVGDRLEDEKCAELAGLPFNDAASWRAEVSDG